MASGTELNKDFKKLADSGRLGHGYLLFGHESAEEKFLFAKELANFLETKKWEASDRILIDARILDAQEEGGIDLARSASQFLWQKPAASPKRTLIINKADNLTLPAQNAILKISEEPPVHALIFLIVKDYNSLLPALQSRFQKIYAHGNSKFPISNFQIPISSRILDGVGTNPNAQISTRFLKAAFAEKKEMLKEIVEENSKMEDFVAGLIIELRRDIVKNWRTLKELLHRWTLINQFNTNKRLQLEAALGVIANNANYFQNNANN